MNIEQLQQDLSSLGTVSTCEISNDMLMISIGGVVNSAATDTSFNQIIDDNNVEINFPIREAYANESGSVKAIYKV
jgi:hypothetical protein